MDDDFTQVITVAHSVDAELDEKVHFLELVDGHDVGRRFLVGASGLTLGRVAPADIVLSDSEVSRSHCRVTLAGDALVVTDLKSTNGTFVDGLKVQGPEPLQVGGVLRVGRHAFKHEWLTGRQFERSDELERDLALAFSYVQALLPPRLVEGPIRSNWFYLPCAKLGGDAFGYADLSPTRFAAYLIDVSGHGAGAAMHSVAVMNLLRQKALPNTDMADPGRVLETLNAMFQMEQHAGMYFTMWYGVYDRETRRLDYASAGHHPAYLRSADRSDLTPLKTRNPIIGAVTGKTYVADSVAVPCGGSLYVFSDGAFEIVTKAGVQWSLADFLPLLSGAPTPGATESERLFKEVRQASRPGEFDDDVSILVLDFE